MELSIIYGRAGSGKSSYLFEKVKNFIKTADKIYIITPEQFSFTAEKKLLEVTDNGAVVNCEVLTFSRMASRVIGEMGSNLKNIEGFGKSMLIFDILDGLKKELQFLGKTTQNVEIVERSITEFKKHNITEAKLEKVIEDTEDEYLKAKLSDLKSIYSKFQDEISNKFLDENDSLTYLAENIKNTNMFDNSIIFIDEFVGFTPQEYRVIEELMKKSKEMFLTICADNLDLEKSDEDTDIFYANKVTANRIMNIANTCCANVLEPTYLENLYRFKSEELIALEQNLYSNTYKKFKGEVKNIELFLAANPYSEIEHVASKIATSVRDDGYRYKEIGVITKNIEIYSGLIKAIFNKYDIPVFIDEKKDLSQNILIKYIISLLEVFAKNWSYDSVMAYVKTKFCDITDDEIYKLENYCKKLGIKYSKWYKEDWKVGESEENLLQLNAIRKKVVEPLLSFKKKCFKDMTGHELSKAIYEFLIENEIDKKLQKKSEALSDIDIDLASEYEASFNIIVKILDEIVKIFGDEVLTFDKYASFLKISFTENGLGKLPAGFDQVTVGDVDRSRSHKTKVIFIIGLNDGSFPSVNNDEGFLNDSDREKLKQMNIELAKTTIEALYNDNFNIYKAHATSEEKLYISYVSSDSDGAAQKPSTLLLKIKKLFPLLRETSDVIKKETEITKKEAVFDELLLNIRNFKDGKEIDKVWFSIYKFFQKDEEWRTRLENSIKALNFSNMPKNISDDSIKKLYGDVLKTSVSKLENYQKCAFSFYLTYGLKLRENESFKLESLDTGSFMHDVIDEFFEEVQIRKINLKEITEEQIKEIIDKIINDKLKLPENYIFMSSAKFRNQTFRLKRLILKAMKYIILSITESDFEVFGHEVEFGENKKYPPIEIELENGKKVQIIGKIDRIDIAKDEEGRYLRIIDYKSSNHSIRLNDVAYGLQLQLLTYLDAACKIEDLEPAAVLYFNLIEEKLDKRKTKEEIEEEIKKNFKMKGLLVADVKLIKMMDNSLESGYSNLVPAYIKGDRNNFREKVKYSNKGAI